MRERRASDEKLSAANSTSKLLALQLQMQLEAQRKAHQHELKQHLQAHSPTLTLTLTRTRTRTRTRTPNPNPNPNPSPNLTLSSLPLSTTESGPHAARSRPSARCNHTATILGESLYVYGGAAGSWEFDDVCRVDLRALRGAQRVLQWELLKARPPRASSLPLPRQHHVALPEP